MVDRVIRGIAPLTDSGRRTRYPDVKFEAVFHKHDGFIVETVSEDDATKTVSDIVRCETYKTIAQPMGTWSMTLVPRRDYLALVEPGDWCEINADNGDGVGLRPVLLGPVTSVNRRRSTNERGATIETVTINGSDFGRAVAHTTALLDAKLADDPAFSNLGWAADAISNLNAIVGSPDIIVHALMEKFFKDKITQWVNPKTGANFGAELDRQSYFDLELLGDTIFQPIILSSPLWTLLQQWANLCVNELFIDYRVPVNDPNNYVDLIPAVVLRQAPYFGDAWDNLTTVEVERSEVIEDSIGRSDADVKNWIRVGDEPRLTGIRGGLSKYLKKVGFMNGDSIAKFGIRRHEPTSIYILGSDTSQEPATLPDILEAITGLNALWHHSNELLYSGTITMNCRPDIRIGYKLDYVDIEAEDYYQYYVESVRHSFQFPGRSTTTIEVTRGRTPNDRRFLYTLEELVDQGVLQGLGDTLSRAQNILG